MFIKKIYLMQMQPSIDTVFSCLQTSFIVDFFSQTLRYKIEEEVRVNSEIETYLRQHHEVKWKIYIPCSGNINFTFMSVWVLQNAHQNQVLKVKQAFLSRIASINMYTRGAYHLHGKHIPLKTLQIL